MTNAEQVLTALAELLADRVAGVVAQRLAQQPAAAPAYDATRRLTAQQAAEHLGISESTLRNRVKAGTVKKHTPPGARTYFVLGELDGTISTTNTHISVTGVRVRARSK